MLSSQTICADLPYNDLPRKGRAPEMGVMWNRKHLPHNPAQNTWRTRTRRCHSWLWLPQLEANKNALQSSRCTVDLHRKQLNLIKAKEFRITTPFPEVKYSSRVHSSEFGPYVMSKYVFFSVHLQRCAGVVQEYDAENNKCREIILCSAIQTMSVGGKQREAREKNQRSGRAQDNVWVGRVRQAATQKRMCAHTGDDLVHRSLRQYCIIILYCWCWGLNCRRAGRISISRHASESEKDGSRKRLFYV